MSLSGPARILLVDDQVLLRGALAATIDRQDDMTVVGEAGSGLEGLEMAHQLQPDLVLMDVEMPIMGGIEAAGLIREQLPEMRIVMLTVGGDDDQFLGAVRRGVHGFLLKDMRPEQLLAMIRSVLSGERAIASSLVGRLMEEVRHSGQVAPTEAVARPEAALSMRELEILRLVAQGMSNREIGSRLSITEGTVKNHVHNALQKLGMDNRIQAAAYIVRQGLGASTR